MVNQPQDSSQLNVKEINDMPSIKKFLQENKKAIVEFFLPSCPHCVEFAPKYETLATIYKDAIPFMKVDCTDPRNFMGLVKLQSFPSLFVYDEGKFFQYEGFFEIELIHQYIENVYYFKCHKLESAEHLRNHVNENKDSNYVIGIFKSKENSQNELKTFLKLNEDIRQHIQNRCYYFVDENYNHDVTQLGINKSFVLTLSNSENFITVYNTKTFNVFDKINNLHSIFIDKKLNDQFIPYNQIFKNYEKFLIDNFYPPWEYLEEDIVSSVLARKKKFIIFSALSKDKAKMKNLMEQFIILKPDISEFDFTVLFVELTEDKKNSKLSEIVQNTEIAIYNKNFDQLFLFEEPTMFEVDKIISAIEDRNKIIADKRKDYKIASSSSLDDSHSNYVTAKIVDKLENEHIKDNVQSENSEKVEENKKVIHSETIILEEKYMKGLDQNNNYTNINTNTTSIISNHPQTKDHKNLIIWIFYIFTYTIIYAVLYRKYFSLEHLGEEIKYN